MALLDPNADMAALFDFAEAAMPDLPQESIEPTPTPGAEASPPQDRSRKCPAHAEADNCLCHGFMDVAAGDAANAAIGTSLNDWWTKDFSTYLPRYSKPKIACEYCHSRQLECFYTFDGQKTCSPCNALFRGCSFAEPNAGEARHPNAVDTLHSLEEDVDAPFGGLTGIRTLKSKHAGRYNQPSAAPARDEEVDGTGKRTGTRFSRAALKILKTWIEAHRDNPYPNEDEKEQLKAETGLTTSQIQNWFANTRRRDRTRSAKRATSPSVRSTQPVTIPDGRRWETLDPMERWKHSPPENEPAPLNAIADAIREFSPPLSSSRSGSFKERHQDSRSSGGASSLLIRAPSLTSLETGQSASAFSSGSASTAAFSLGSFGSFGSFGSNPLKERRRRRKIQQRSSKPQVIDNSDRVFQCTFCTDRFKSKYDWSRHEKSLHLSLEKWICAPLGDIITITASGQKMCTYCDLVDPSQEHLDSHNHKACEEKGMASRTFYRKDHLRQHLRLMHNCKMTKSMESWKSEATYIKSRCGFCGLYFAKWQDRVDHLAKEFRNGCEMKDWKGCRGFDLDVASLITNAMPTYLIDSEARSPFPFSATNMASMVLEQNWIDSADAPNGLLGHSSGSGSPSTGLETSPTLALSSEHVSSNNPNAALGTCWEILTLRLGQYVRQWRGGGVTITDAMLQREARRILYEDPDDTWNQTSADNPEWLALFKKAHGLGDVPGDFNLTDAIEDLGVMAGIKLDENLPVRQSAIADQIWKGLGRLPCSSSDNMGQFGSAAATTAGFALPTMCNDQDINWNLVAPNLLLADQTTQAQLPPQDMTMDWSNAPTTTSECLQPIENIQYNPFTAQPMNMDLGDLDAPFAWDESFDTLPVSSVVQRGGMTQSTLERVDEVWCALTGTWCQELAESKAVCLNSRNRGRDSCSVSRKEPSPPVQSSWSSRNS